MTNATPLIARLAEAPEGTRVNRWVYTAHISWMPYSHWMFRIGQKHGGFLLWCWRLYVATEARKLPADAVPGALETESAGDG